MIDWPDQLISDLGRRRVIVMIGSGISRHSVGNSSVKPPTWRAFLKDALRKCNPEPSHIKSAISRGQYLDACDWLKRSLDERWGPSLRQSFLTPKFKPAKIHELIYQLDARVVLTPNFDKIYDNYAATESEGTIAIKKYYDDDIIDFLRRGDRIVLKGPRNDRRIWPYDFHKSAVCESKDRLLGVLFFVGLTNQYQYHADARS